ncbi:sugar phosphate isomerase/epimerase family protein [Sphingobacterium sp. UDSM-2020]|uniref:sugar phosphate isomerase/epimerase family protein n=1 Tax=Sphingobacterium TaxID=28453 RepID=UPI0019351A44|nr:sugar phosphate isomerase/epimerase [Sphingobacterium sp. UDSM-2020]QQD14146.1 sugar phosphate isomerase/epimerase [Sphingobacterium sp. UDSM-2020]
MKLKFLTCSLLFVVAGMGSIFNTVQAQEQLLKKEIGLQLYSVRSMIGSHVQPDTYNADYFSVLQKLAKMGYTSVESAGYKDGMFYNTTPQVFKNNVEKAGMKVLSSHASRTLTQEELASGDFSKALTWWKETIIAHKAAGIKYIVTPWLDLPKTIKDLDTECQYLNEIGQLCREYGIKYGYHNHAHEFEKVEGKVVMLDYMIEHTKPENVFFEMDVYWTIIGKASPVDYFKKYPGRYATLHIKDHREIGQSGMVGFDAIFANTDIAGVENIFVELEETTADLEVGLKQSIDYLLKAPFVKKTYQK